MYPNLKNPERISKILKKKAEKYDLKGVNFPCGFSDIDQFEKNNNISLNILGYEDGEFFIKRESGKRYSTHVNLLLFEKNGISHYCLIKNKSRLLSSEKSKHDGKEFFCDYCFQGLTSHLEYCKNHKFIKTYFPEKGETLKFTNFERIHDVPFRTYADFECCLKPIDNQIGSNTKQLQKHIISGYCYIIKCFDDTLFKPILRQYTRKSDNEDVTLKFMKSLEKDYRKIYRKFKFPRDVKDFKNAKKCYACGNKFRKKNIKVRDHCHFSGKYRGAACKDCNFRMRKPKFMPVILHNLQNYDSHLFIKSLGVTEGEIKCIAKTEEKYISFSKEIIMGEFKKNGKIIKIKRELRFIDSFKFMASSLEKLVKNLDKDDIEIIL